MRLYATVGFLGLMSYGCSDPRCPANLVQVGNSCRCPEGTQKSGPTCVEIDAGALVDAAWEDDEHDAEPAETGDARTQSPSPDVDASALTGGGSADAGAPDAGEMLGCYVDRDKDGVGAGSAVSCKDDALIISLGFALSSLTGDCDDMDPARSPRLSDICGDNIDNDCDSTADDESNNACGGPCTLPLLHRPGEACENGSLGSCKRTGTYVCEGAGVRCNAPMMAPGTEVCADSIDNDCDGASDEPDAADAVTWYQDCDGDGFAASTAGSVRACEKPNNTGLCTWTSVMPQVETKTNWDCDDSSPSYNPAAQYGFPPAGVTNWDLNCDGIAVADATFWPTETVCVTTISEEVNNGVHACSAQYVGAGCLVFKNPEGGFSRPGSQNNNAGRIVTCPDLPHLVTLSFTIDACDVSSAPRSPVWPCR